MYIIILPNIQKQTKRGVKLLILCELEIWQIIWQAAKFAKYAAICAFCLACQLRDGTL
jgi:hypothetical protein